MGCNCDVSTFFGFSGVGHSLGHFFGPLSLYKLLTRQPVELDLLAEAISEPGFSLHVCLSTFYLEPHDAFHFTLET